MRRGLSRLRSVVAQVAYQSGGVPTNSSGLPQRAAEPSTWASAQSTGRSQFGTTPAEARTAKDRARRAQRSKQQQEVQQRLHAESSVNGSVTASAQQQPQPPASRARMVRATAARMNGSGNSSSLGSSTGGPSSRSPPAAAAAASASSGDASNTAARSRSGSFSSPSSSPIAHAAGWPETSRPTAAAAAAGRTAAPGGYASASPSPAAAGGNGAPVAPSRQQQAATQWTPQPRSTAALVEELHAGNGSSSSSSNSLQSEVASTSTSPEAGISAEQIAQTYKNEPPPDVHVVNTLAGARAAAAQLMALVDAPQHGGQPLIFACDTEVMDIDVSSHSPCCHGRVICFSVYAGPSVHFGEQAPPAGAPLRSMLWVDTWLDGDEARAEEAAAIVDTFRPFWESERHKKVWHNYSFDRHVMERLGVGMAGFDGDTMHMARLWDSSRGSGRGGYSLEALSSDRSLMDDGSGGEQDIRGKVSMKTLFGRRNLKKDGTEGKLTILPPVHELQRDAATRWRWVNYSAFDAKSTWDLYQRLRHELMAMEAVLDAAVASDYAQAGIRLESMWDVYRHTWLPFGGLLTDMEAVGMAVDRAHLAAAQQQAEADQAQAQERFRRWASSRVGDAKYMNVGSGAQVQQLLFAGAANALSQGSKGVDKPPLPLERVFKVPNVDGLKNEGDKRAKKNVDITLHGVWGRGAPSPLKPEVYTAGGLPACSTPVLKSLAGKAGKARKKLAELGLDKPGEDLSGLRGMLDVAEEEEEGVLGLEEEGEEEEWEVDDEKILQAQREMQQKNQQLEDAMAPKSLQELEALAAKEGYGRLFSAFSSVAEGLYACDAVDSLVDASAIDTLLSNFIVPLQSDDISKPDSSGVYRVHCSLNINTETGRLSARRPNLQNQPALEKDRYKVRKAFRADVAAGKTLVVADYGQLELRILAHMANCRSMIEAFEMGGDFHSRTALGMYDHIKEAIAKEQCLLEWEGEGEPPLPLLKDMFASERRKAKVLNFSIAYGKTAHGLSKDWKVTIQEAEDTVKRWYESRPEVQKWQKERREDAVTKGYVTTILGRRRQLPDARNTRNKAAQGHALRAAINTPIQGSAADIATAAMLRIAADPELREMGWRLLLQVHDEVILEGPKETAEQARARVVACMRSPFSGLTPKPLLVDLVVDAKHADTWYEAK